jgi:hypothetical protein
VTDEDPNELRPSLSADVLTEDDRPRRAVRDRQNPSFVGPCSMARPGLEPGTRDAVAADAAAPVERLLIAMGFRHAGQPERSRCSSGAPATHASSSTTTAAGRRGHGWRRSRSRALVGELLTQSEEFRTRWAAHNVRLQRDRRQGLPPLRRRRPQPHLQPHRAVRRPRAGDDRLDRRARLEVRGSPQPAR